MPIGGLYGGTQGEIAGEGGGGIETPAITVPQLTAYADGKPQVVYALLLFLEEIGVANACLRSEQSVTDTSIKPPARRDAEVCAESYGERHTVVGHGVYLTVHSFRAIGQLANRCPLIPHERLRATEPDGCCKGVRRPTYTHTTVEFHRGLRDLR